MQRNILDKAYSLKSKCLAGDVSFGMTITTGNKEISEIVSNHDDTDFVLIDLEHTTMGLNNLHTILMGLNHTNIVPIVRIHSEAVSAIQRSLDLGVGGVIFPMVKSIHELEYKISLCKYPPQGTRGFGPKRAISYTSNANSYFSEANKSLITILLIEHIDAINEIDKILKVSGLDAVFIGPVDLALSMGLGIDGLDNNLELSEVVSSIIRSCKSSRIPLMMVAPSGKEQIMKLLNDGVTLIGLGTDMAMFDAILKEKLKNAKETLKSYSKKGDK